jgi:hypothetical protein
MPRTKPARRQPAIKDAEGEYPVPTAWRPAFKKIVRSFLRGDFQLKRCDPRVKPISLSTARHIRNYIADYGETLAPLHDATWKSSVSAWNEGWWDVIVDLWTVESGRSDMIIDARVFQVGRSFRIEVHLVYVP